MSSTAAVGCVTMMHGTEASAADELILNKGPWGRAHRAGRPCATTTNTAFPAAGRESSRRLTAWASHGFIATVPRHGTCIYQTLRSAVEILPRPQGREGQAPASSHIEA